MPTERISEKRASVLASVFARFALRFRPYFPGIQRFALHSTGTTPGSDRLPSQNLTKVRIAVSENEASWASFLAAHLFAYPATLFFHLAASLFSSLSTRRRPSSVIVCASDACSDLGSVPAVQAGETTSEFLSNSFGGFERSWASKDPIIPSSRPTSTSYCGLAAMRCVATWTRASTRTMSWRCSL